MRRACFGGKIKGVTENCDRLERERIRVLQTYELLCRFRDSSLFQSCRFCSQADLGLYFKVCVYVWVCAQ
jgi:hypothetical protein